MTKNKTQTGKSTISGMIIAVILGLIVAAITIVGFALLLTKKDIDFVYLKYFWLATAVFPCFIAGVVAELKTKLKGVVAGGISSIIVAAVILCLLAVLNGGSTFPFAFFLLPIALFCGSIGGIIASNMR